MNNSVEAAISIAIGLGLAAAAGFRIFVPLLVAAIAARYGHLPLSAGFDWLGTTPAIVALGTATLLEVVAYYVPWLDNALDVVATPSAVVAGIIASASVMTDLPPVLKWGVSLIAGGGIAGLVQGATVLARLKSTVTTAGAANPLVATFELVGSFLTSVFSIIIPIIVLLLVAMFCVAIFWVSHKVMFGRRKRRLASESGP